MVAAIATPTPKAYPNQKVVTHPASITGTTERDVKSVA
jgi:hypothetical protein